MTTVNYGSFLHQVLIIDDDADDQEILSSGIDDLGASRIIFSSGHAALQYLRQSYREHHPELIITDFHMPCMNGLEVLTNLKSDDQLCHIPVIVYSSSMDETLQSMFAAHGAAACFSKSNGLAELRQFLLVLDIIIRHRSCQNEPTIAQSFADIMLPSDQTWTYYQRWLSVS